jgi:hypothetical protein
MTIPPLSPEEQLTLLGSLLNNLHEQGIIPRQALVNLASEVMAMDYLEDEELICFQCLDEVNDEEE